VKDTKFNRSLFQLQASVLRTEEKESGSLLPTPVSSDAGAGAIIGKDDRFRMTKNGTLRKINRNNKDGSLGLGKRATLGVLQNPELIKEMNLDGKTYQEVRMWPTPRTGGGSRPNQKGGKVLNEEVLIAEGLRERGKTLEEMKMWRTPDAHCDRGPSSEKRMKMKLEKKMPISINDQVAHPNLMWPTPTQDSATERTKKYKQGGTPLTLAVKMWPTPSRGMYKQDVNDNGEYAQRIKDKGHQIMLPAAVKLRARNWPTPTARDWKDSGKAVVNSTRHLLPQAVAKSDKETWIKGGGALNPMWVEWLMGYPAGYTDLKDWAMLSSRKSRKQ
jgi:hypothetical protein